MTANNIALVGLVKSLDKTLSTVPVGVHAVDATYRVHVRGTITKAKDGSYTPTVDIPLKAAMALLLEKAGIVGPHAQAMLVAAMTEALNSGEDKEDAIAERMKDVDAAMATVRESLEALPKKTRSGATSVKCEVEVEEVVEGLSLVNAA